MSHAGKLWKNDNLRWEFDGFELTSGNRVEVQIASQWIPGRIEYMDDIGYVFLAGREGVPVILQDGLMARVS